jgi:NodT family efflux transporter outer membrane factor (OMF) lipoprotein
MKPWNISILPASRKALTLPWISLAGSTRRNLFAVAALAALAGCALAPSDQAPAVAEPQHYGAMPQVDGTAPALGQAQHFVSSQAPMARWWEAYGSAQLDSLVDEALAGNLDLASARHRLEAAREQWSAQAGATRLPSVDIGAQASRQRDLSLPIQGLPPTSLYNTYVGQAQLSYTFDIFGANRYQTQALAHRVDQQHEELQAARNAVAANVVSGAISLAGLQAQIRVLETLIGLSEHDARDMSRQYALGAVPHSSVLDAQRNLASLSAQLPELRARALTARHALATLLGRTPDQAPEAPEFDRLSLPTELPVLVPSALLAARPDIRAADAALKTASADAGAAAANMFPRLTLSASMGRGGFDWATATSGAGAIWSLASSITAPVFHGGALRAQHRAALQIYEAAADAYRRTVLSAFQDVADALASIEQVSESLQQAEQAQSAAQALYGKTRQQVAMGALPAVAARGMARQAAQAKLDALRYETERLLDTARLLHAMGSAPEAGEG